jgi:hypothetical protein
LIRVPDHANAGCPILVAHFAASVGYHNPHPRALSIPSSPSSVTCSLSPGPLHTQQKRVKLTHFHRLTSDFRSYRALPQKHGSILGNPSI